MLLRAEMAIFSLIFLVTVLKTCSAEMSVLEKFLTSGFNEDTTSDTEQENEPTYVANTEDLVKFMKRSGLIHPDDQQKASAALQSLTPQQAAYYLPQIAQQSHLYNYVHPQRQQQPQEQQSQQEQLKQQQLQQQKQQQLQRYKLQLQKLQDQLLQRQAATQSPSIAYPDTNSQGQSTAESEPQQSTDSKTVSKADRQGFYGHDDGAGYTGHAGYVNANDGFSDHQDTYSGGHYAHEPVAYKPPVYQPPKQASVAIRLDPLGFLRLLLQGIPRPLLNLNGKVFFGVELGKNAGLVKGGGGGGYAAPPSGKGIVLNLG